MTDTETSAEAVERYAAPFLFSTQRRAVMESRSHGDWVRYSDYKALRAERDQLQAQLEKAKAGLTQIAEMKPHHAGQTPNEYHMQEIARDALADFDNALEAARDALEGAVVGVRVKPLVWGGRGAFCEFGVYQIVNDDDGDFGYRFSGNPNVVFWHWKAEVEAKAAAQADYERRILAALEPGQTPAEAYRAGLEAATDIINNTDYGMDYHAPLTRHIRALPVPPEFGDE